MTDSATLAARRGGLCTAFLKRKERLEKAVAQAKSLKNDYAMNMMRKCREQVFESYMKIEECILKEDELDPTEAKVKKREEDLNKYEDYLKKVEDECDKVEKSLATPATAQPVAPATADNSRPPPMPKANDLLKPPQLQVDDKPSVLRQFKKDYKIFFNHYKMSALTLEEQQAFFNHCLSKKLHSRIAPKIRDATPVLTQAVNGQGVEPESCFKILDDEFRRNYPLVRRRRDFFECRQKSGQLWSDWNIRLKELAQEAELQDIKADDLIMHMQMELTTDDEIKSKFLREHTPDLDKLETIARSIEQARSCQKGQEASVKATFGQNRAKSSQKDQKPCWRCKKTGHQQNLCPYKDKECHQCGEVGHIKPACKKSSDTKGSSQKRGQSKAKAKQADASEDSGTKASASSVRPAIVRVAKVTEVNSAGRAINDSFNQPTPRMECDVSYKKGSKSSKVVCLPDCGATQSMIKLQVARKTGLPVDPKRRYSNRYS